MIDRRRFLTIALGTGAAALAAACGANQTPAAKPTEAPKPAAKPTEAAAKPAASPAASPAAAKPGASPSPSPAAGAAAKPAAAASTWQPSGSIELVVPYAPGGGSSITAQEINRAIQANKLLPEPFNITNKPGASGSTGLAYVVEKKGNPQVLATGVDSGLVTNKLHGNAPHDFEDLTPISLLAVDETLIATHAGSQFQSMKDLIDFAKANPGKVTAGGTGATGTEALVFALLQDAAGIEVEYVPFNSGGEVNAALLGGHVDVAASNPNEFFPNIEAGTLRPLATMAQTRIKQIPDTPTMKELGYEKAVIQLGRGVVAAPGIPAEAVRFYEDLFKKVSETAEWKEYVEKNGMTPSYRDAKGYIEYLRQNRDQMRELIPLLKS